MSGYSPYELLNVEPGQRFDDVLSAFTKSAQLLEVVGAAIDERDEAIDDWRTLCEAADWLVKQPIREPTKSIACPRCGGTTTVALLRGWSECANCGNALHPNPAVCTSCKTTNGIPYGTDYRTIYCGACGKYTLKPS